MPDPRQDRTDHDGVQRWCSIAALQRRFDDLSRTCLLRQVEREELVPVQLGPYVCYNSAGQKQRDKDSGAEPEMPFHNSIGRVGSPKKVSSMGDGQ